MVELRYRRGAIAVLIRRSIRLGHIHTLGAMKAMVIVADNRRYFAARSKEFVLTFTVHTVQLVIPERVVSKRRLLIGLDSQLAIAAVLTSQGTIRDTTSGKFTVRAF
jgi:hypothetical protein